MIDATPETLRDTADDVLSRPEFSAEQPSPVQRALDWILEEIGSVLGAITGASSGYLFGYLIIGVAAAAALYFLWRYLPRSGYRRATTGAAATSETLVRRSRREWLELADAAEADNDWAAAVHARYHALATGLAELEQVPAPASTTSGEHRRAFAESTAGDQARNAAFSAAADTYEDVWFGGEGADSAESGQLREVDRHLVDGAGT